MAVTAVKKSVNKKRLPGAGKGGKITGSARVCQLNFGKKPLKQQLIEGVDKLEKKA